MSRNKMAGNITRTLTLLLLTGLFSSLANACPKSNCVRIGTWNIEWLGSDKRSQPVDANTINAMADLIANQLSIDIITLQEINTELDGKVRGDHYSLKPWQDLQQALKRYGYQSHSGGTGNAQHIVLAWRAPVQELQPAGDLPIPDHYELHEYCRSSYLRKPLAGQFRANQFDFWLVGVHLKANGPDSKCTADIRKAQSKALAQTLGPLLKKDPDIILIGDFNTSSRNKSLQALLDANFKTLNDKKQRSPASASRSYHSETSQKASDGSLIDHIMITDATHAEWQIKSTTIYKPKDAKVFANTFSDHVPVWADFYTHQDDD